MKTPEAEHARPTDHENEERFWEAVRVELEEGKRPDPAAEAEAARHVAAERGWLCIDIAHAAIRGACRRLNLRHNRSNIVAFLVGSHHQPPEVRA